MKKKYFFGILICLVLLCGGVFLLSANSNPTNINDNLTNQEVESGLFDTSKITTQIYAYGSYMDDGSGYVYSYLGGDIKVTHQICYSDGSGASGGLTNPIGRTTRSPGSVSTEHYNPFSLNARKTTVSISNYLGGLSNPRFYWRSTEGKSFIGEMNDAGGSYTFTVSLYWNVTLTLNANQGSGGSSSCVYDTYSRGLTSTITRPSRAGYTFQGYYTAASGGTQWIDGSGRITSNLTRENAGPRTLYAHWILNDYQIDTNILSPNGTQDYNSGTMIQSYNGQTSDVTTDQVYSSIKADTTLTIKDINPATGMYVSSIIHSQHLMV